MTGFPATLLFLAAVQDAAAFKDVGDRVEHFATPLPALYGDGWDKVRLVPLPGCPLGGEAGWRMRDMLERPGAGYLLVTRSTSAGEGEARTRRHEARVLESADAETWVPVLGFEGPRLPRLLEEWNGDFYFGLSRSELLRVRRAAYAGS